MANKHLFFVFELEICSRLSEHLRFFFLSFGRCQMALIVVFTSFISQRIFFLVATYYRDKQTDKQIRTNLAKAFRLTVKHLADQF